MSRNLLAGLLVLILAPCLYASNKHGGRGKGSSGYLNISTVSLLDGTVGAAYSQTLTATGGTAPYTWAVTGGVLPPPLVLAAGTGIISGTPTTSGIFSFIVTVTDSAAHTYSSAFGLTIASAGGATILSDGFESGNFAAWDSAGGFPNNNPFIETTVVRSGTYSYGNSYVICGDSTNSACGAAHQGMGRYLTKNFTSANGFPNGLDHFFLRGYFRIHINLGGTPIIGVGRKLFYWFDSLADTWHGIVAANISSYTFGFGSDLGGQNIEFGTGTLRNNVPCPTSLIGTCSSVIYNWVPDAWYYLELELQANTPGAFDGLFNVWIQKVGVDPIPIKMLSGTGVSFRGSQTTGMGLIRIGEQADRQNWQVVDELRYWDDIKISTSYIGP